jgi:prevent-host-death family protein
MPIVGLRDLSRNTREVIEQLEKDGEPVVVTRHGKPIAMLKGVAEEDAATLSLAAVPANRESRIRAAEEIAAGEGESATALLRELEEDDADGVEAIEIPTSVTAKLVDIVLGDAVAMSRRERRIVNDYVAALVENAVLRAVQRTHAVDESAAERRDDLPAVQLEEPSVEAP